MNVRDFINKKKQEFFVAKTPDALRTQKTALAKEHAVLKETDTLRREVIQEQRDIRSLRSAPAREKLAAVQTGLGRFKGASERANKFFQGNEPAGLIAAHDRRKSPGLPETHSSPGLPKPSGGIFDQTEKETKKEQINKGGKVVHIHVR